MQIYIDLYPEGRGRRRRARPRHGNPLWRRNAVWVVAVVLWLAAAATTARLGDPRSFYIVHAIGLAIFAATRFRKRALLRRQTAFGPRSSGHDEFAPLLLAEGVAAAVATGSSVLLAATGSRPLWWLPVEGVAACWGLVATVRWHRTADRELKQRLREIGQRFGGEPAVVGRRMAATMGDPRGWISEPPPDLQAAARRLERAGRNASRTVA